MVSPAGISGAELAERAREQANRLGAEILILREGVRGELSPGKGTVYLEDGTKIVSRASICATGMQYRKLNRPNEDRLRGAGVYYGAGSSEAELCWHEHVVVVGGGNSGAQASVHFSASKVSLVVRDNSLKKTVSQYLIDRVSATPNMEVLTCTEVAALRGDNVLEAVTLRNKDTGRERHIKTNWLFLCLGGTPHTEWAKEVGLFGMKAAILSQVPICGPMATFRKCGLLIVILTIWKPVCRAFLPRVMSAVIR